MEDIKKLDAVLSKYQPTHVVNRGVGPLSLLGIVLVVLKAMGYINISWLWVFAPFWVPIICVLVFIIGVYFFLNWDDIEDLNQPVENKLAVIIEDIQKEEITKESIDSAKPKKTSKKRSSNGKNKKEPKVSVEDNVEK